VFLFNSEGKLLLQQRAASKVTFPNVWTNTCCSHPLFGYQPTEIDSDENIANGTVPGAKAAAIRKLDQELGITSEQVPISKFKFLTRLHYWAADVVTHGPKSPWGEHEIDYILFIQQDVQIHPNPDEVSDTCYVTLDELKAMMKPESGLLWSPWFRIIAENFLPFWWEDLNTTLTTNSFVDVKTIHRFDPTTEHMGGEGDAGSWLGQSQSPYSKKTPTLPNAAKGNDSPHLKQGAYGKVPIHKSSLASQLLHFDEVIAGIQLLFNEKFPSSPNTSLITNEHVAFCDDMLGRVSRSFAAVIRQLPPGLTVDITVFYLVLRALDTVEDDMTAFISNPSQKITYLQTFHSVALGDLNWSLTGVGEGDEATLLAKFHHVAHVFQSLSSASQIVIKDITHRMGKGMAEYVGRDLGQGTNSVAEYDLYCHYVAGLVGEGLTRLFVATGYELTSLDEISTTLANTMGLFLQKTNIIRDYLEDYVDGRSFWPKEIWGQYTNGDLGSFLQPGNDLSSMNCLNHMILNALECVPDCLDYMSLLRDEKVFQFCAIPQVMAIATLAELYQNPLVFTGVVKIRKGLAAKLILESSSMFGIHKTFQRFTRTILNKIPSLEAKSATTPQQKQALELYKKTRQICEKIIELTEEKAMIAKQYDLLDRSLSVVCVMPFLMILRRYQTPPLLNGLAVLLGYPLVMVTMKILTANSRILKWLRLA
jgi:farnesyl-diphosphate farnesyltransferase